MQWGEGGKGVTGPRVRTEGRARSEENETRPFAATSGSDPEMVPAPTLLGRVTAKTAASRNSDEFDPAQSGGREWLLDGAEGLVAKGRASGKKAVETGHAAGRAESPGA